MHWCVRLSVFLCFCWWLSGCDEPNPTLPQCGDGVVEGDEECDDGNTENSDECTNLCNVAVCGDGIIQLGDETCDDANAVDTDECPSDCQVAVCGDGHLWEGRESCDDGNDDNSDGCTSTCELARCGDGFVQTDEACDDGNALNNDGCLADCSISKCGDGFVNVGVEACDDGNDIDADRCRNDCTLPTCGDGVVHAGEACDDGNMVDSDDCLPSCLKARCGDGIVHDGFEACDDGNAEDGDACRTDCTDARCGDGVLHIGVEECDDGNSIDTDGCLSNCQLPRCGDGIVQAGEECDDGNDIDSDGCRNHCQVAVCGDGVVYVDPNASIDLEQNLNNGDDIGGVPAGGAQAGGGGSADNPASAGGASAGGLPEGGHASMGGASAGGSSAGEQAPTGGSSAGEQAPTGGASAAGAEMGGGPSNGGNSAGASGETGGNESSVAGMAGGGLIEAGPRYEACDDGNNNDLDGCRNDCTVARCGDGVVHVGVEQCDDGNDVNDDGCRNDCRLPRCGDGVVQAGEACDDGNSDETDECRNDCARAVCGDGILRGDVLEGEPGYEACDDGNVNHGDACRNDCRIAVCGDGIVHVGVEACDDGNNNDNDDCLNDCTQATCGDSVVWAGVEACDDGNNDDTDGCLANCETARCGDGAIQVGVEACDDGNLDNHDDCLNDCAFAGCGDGVLLSGVEACDDGNDNDNDACRNSCLQATCGDGIVWEGVEECDDGNAEETDGCLNSCRKAFCGDGIVQANEEECDDGNDNDLDGCRNDCSNARCGDGVVEIGQEACDDGNDSDADGCLTNCTLPTCGDGVRHIGEGCDDNNDDETDGCRSNCLVAVCGDGITRTDVSIGEPGYEVCDDGNDNDRDACRNDCRPSECGDGIVRVGLAPGELGYEACDDGNRNDTDECLSNCAQAQCGDGVVWAGVEECDDGNDVDDDGCRNDCRLPRCGDGVQQAGEDCDDGNDNNRDGCLNDCQFASCGDGILRVGLKPGDDGFEACDDGNANDNDRCLSDCSQASCGDGVTWFGVEGCDDGNDINDDACRNDCRLAGCGDGVVQAGEGCDDGNDNNQDECRNDCQLPTCGDGVVHVGQEMCDDGNRTDNDGCTNTCINARCGDGIVWEGIEACDDSDQDNANGCTNGCTLPRCGDGIVQAGEACDDGNDNDQDDCRNDCQQAACGDGIVHVGHEECDDGNRLETDACTNACENAKCGDGLRWEGIEACDDGDNINDNECSNRCKRPECGDGIIQLGEACDDANSFDNDGCLSNCVEAECGDGIVHIGVEACDDGNRDNADRCTNQCALPTCGDEIVQDGEDCDDGNADNTDDCLNTCLAARCGDGFVQADVEACDDGNRNQTDECLNDCTVARCGDGIVQAGVEDCDDTNNVDTDMCTNACRWATCGDGIVWAGVERCDDENDAAGDGCAECVVEDGWDCADNTCQSICGDELVVGDEECDDGNDADDDACIACRDAFCGDGFVQLANEECDDQNDVNEDECTNQCQDAECGDGIVGPGEQCDDQNDVDDDECDNTCQRVVDAAEFICQAATFDNICSSAFIAGPNAIDTNRFPDWTFESWFKWADDGGEDFQHLLFVGSAVPNQITRKIHLEIINRQGGQVRFREWDQGREITVPLPDPSAWHHVAVTSADGQFVMYIDGRQVGQTAGNLPDLRNHDLSFGGVWHRNQPNIWNGCGYGFKGTIASVRISSRLRYANDFQPTYAWDLDDDTIGQWEFGAIENDTVRDTSGNHRDLVFDRAPSGREAVPDAICDIDDAAFDIVHRGAGVDDTRWERPTDNPGRGEARTIQNVPSQQACANLCRDEDTFECRGFLYKHSGRQADSDEPEWQDRACTLLSTLQSMQTGIVNIDSGRLTQADDGCTDVELAEVVYRVCNAQVTQAEAAQACVDAGFDGLASIYSAEEQAAIEAVVDDNYMYWFGLFSDDALTWLSSGEIFDANEYENFRQGEPDGSGQCWRLDARFDFEWADGECNTNISTCAVGCDGWIDRPYGYICEKASNQQAIACTSLDFDGNSTFVQTEADLPNGAYTVETWTRIDDLKLGQPGGGASFISTGRLSIGIYPDGSLSVEEPGASGLVASGAQVPTGQWVHLAWVYDGGGTVTPADWNFFINGTQIGNEQRDGARAPNISGEDILIGSWPGNPGVSSKFLDGVIHSLRVSEGVRYAQNFEPEDQLSDDETTIGLWVFDAGQGNSVRDISGNGFDGTVEEPVTWIDECPGNAQPDPVDEPAACIAAAFDGVAAINAGDVIGGEPEGTIEFWMRANAWDMGNRETITVMSSSTIGGDLMMFGAHIANNHDRLVFGFYRDGGGGWHFADSGIIPELNVWYHVAGTWDERQLSIFVNGQLAGVQDNVAAAPLSNGFVMGNGTHGQAGGLVGDLSDVRISNRVRYGDDFEPPSPSVLDDTTLSLWPLDDGQGLSAREVSARANAGGLVNGAQWRNVCDDAGPPANENRDAARFWRVIQLERLGQVDRGNDHSQRWGDIQFLNGQGDELNGQLNFIEPIRDPRLNPVSGACDNRGYIFSDGGGIQLELLDAANVESLKIWRSYSGFEGGVQGARLRVDKSIDGVAWLAVGQVEFWGNPANPGQADATCGWSDLTWDEEQPPADENDGSSQQRAAASCDSLLQNFPGTASGVYWLNANDGQDAFQAHCDMDTDGGGWTMVFISLGGDQITPGGLDYTLNEALRVAAVSTEALVANRNRDTEVLGNEWAAFDLPDNWTVRSPFRYGGETEVVRARIAGGPAQEQSLLYGYNDYHEVCQNNRWFAPQDRGQFCLGGPNSAAPKYLNFAGPNPNEQDTCTATAVANSNWGQRCAPDRRFTIGFR